MEEEIKFKEFQKELEEIKYRSEKKWEIFLPFDTSREVIQTIIEKCRKHYLTNWHIVYPEPTNKIPEPEVEMFWDKKVLDKI